MTHPSIILTDAQGNALTGADRASAALYEEAATAFNLYRGDPVALLDAALATSPRFVMAALLKAWLYALATEPEAAAEAEQIVAATDGLPMTDRERSHLAALKRLLAGEWTGAALALDRHSMTWPRDLVALQAGHLLDFYRASARGLRDRIARALPAWSDADPGHSVLLGMHAFGLEEMGDYARAEAMGHRAIEAQPLDCWAHHAVAHVLEMQGRAADGIAWMDDREPWWSGEDNFFKVHNWWHKALYHIDLGQSEEALALYDGRVRAARSAVALDLVDASALLWRLSMAGIDTGDRWDELGTAWEAHADGKLYPFNDLHAAMAYLGAGRGARVSALLAAYDGAAASEAGAWGRRPGRDLIAGFADFHAGRFEAAVDKLHRGRGIANAFGGSHAQRDVIDWTLTEAALRGGGADVAASLAAERLSLKPHSPVNRAFLRRAGEVAA